MIIRRLSFRRHWKPIIPVKRPLILKCLLAAVLTAPLTGCLTQRTVTEGGTTVKQGYVIKRPLKEAIENSR